MKPFNAFLSCLVILCTASCTKTFDDVVATEKGVLQHNYVAISAADGSTASVEVSYSVSDGHGGNTQLTKTVSTPVLIGGEDVSVIYDVIVQKVKSGGKTKDGARRRVLKRNYGIGGADQLSIKNLSDVNIRYCVVGNQPLQYFKPDELNGYELTNQNDIDKDRVIKNAPSPIYKLAPVLYLLKPELAPDNDSWMIAAKGSVNSVSGKFGVAVPLRHDHIGEISRDLPLSIDAVIELYKDESMSLFFDYWDAAMPALGGVNFNLGAKYPNASVMQGDVAAHQTLRNGGQLWFVNTNLGYLKVDEF